VNKTTLAQFLRDILIEFAFGTNLLGGRWWRHFLQHKIKFSRIFFTFTL